mgnify:CR=1 FL=1
MWNIIKALNYQITRDNMTIYTCIFLIPLPFLSFILNPNGIKDLTGSIYMANSMAENFLPALIAALLLTTRICGWDMNDKTINYELLYGHRRNEVFFGRILTACVWSLVVGILIFFLPLFFVIAINGWGESIVWTDAVIRSVLFLLPFMRQMALFIMITFLVSNSTGGMIGSLIVFEGTLIGCELLEDSLSIECTTQTAYSNMMQMITFSNGRNQLIGGKEIPVYASELAPGMITGTIIVSMVMIFVYIGIGYLYFRKRDMN